MKQTSVMKLSFIGFLFLGLSFILIGCQNNAPAIVDVEDYDGTIKVDDEFAKDYDGRSSKRHTGTKCRDKDRGDECFDICQEIYGRSHDDTCAKYAVSQIDAFEEIHDILNKPLSVEELEEIHPDDLGVYISISAEPIEDRIEDYDDRHVERIFIWMVESEGDYADYSEDIAKVFSEASSNFGLLLKLLKLGMRMQMML